MATADDSAARRIAIYNQKRHTHNADQPRCRNCASFVSKGEPENGQLRYYCESCERWILEYVG